MFDYKRKYKKISDEYGTEKMNLDSILVVVMLIFCEVFIRTTNGMILKIALRYFQLILLTGSLLIITGILFYKKHKKGNKYIKFIISIIAIILFCLFMILLVPIGLFFRTKQFIEIITKFRISETKLQVLLVSFIVTSFVSAIFLGAGSALIPLLFNKYSVNYIFILSIMAIMFFIFKYISKSLYYILVILRKDIYSKRKVLYAYYQDHKEQNIILFILLLGLTIYCYIIKTQDEFTNGCLSAVTTIVLYDTIVDKWKKNFAEKR